MTLPPLRHAGVACHPVHGPDRHWPQSNCSLDLWISFLHSKGLAPEALMGALIQIDDEGDQFTFCKFDTTDLSVMHGLVLRELAIFDHLQSHIATQTARGNLVMVELDGFHMPDTQTTSYHREHTKTSLGIDLIDPVERRLGYFHNSGYYTLNGADYDALFQVDSLDRASTGTLFPYAEYVLPKREPLRGAALKRAATDALRGHLSLAPRANPFQSYLARFDADVAALITRGNAYFHVYAFNHFRQFGAAFGLFGAFLEWLEEDSSWTLPLIAHCEQIAAKAKLLQFRVVRAVARGRADDSRLIVLELAVHWDTVISGLRQRFT
jgi:Domain of unknown function (DUF1839)